MAPHEIYKPVELLVFLSGPWKSRLRLSLSSKPSREFAVVEEGRRRRNNRVATTFMVNKLQQIRAYLLTIFGSVGSLA